VNHKIRSVLDSCGFSGHYFSFSARYATIEIEDCREVTFAQLQALSDVFATKKIDVGSTTGYYGTPYSTVTVYEARIPD
jgi:RNA binding exosome subunit